MDGFTAWVVNAALTIFEMQTLMKKVPQKLELSKEDAAMSAAMREVFLARLRLDWCCLSLTIFIANLNALTSCHRNRVKAALTIIGICN